MTGLSDSDLAYMREAIDDLLPDFATILSVTHVADGQGGQTDTWGTAYSRIPFRLDMTTGREMIAGGALQPYTKYKGSLPYDTTITTLNRILHSGITYAVVALNADQSWKAVVRVDLEKV